MHSTKLVWLQLGWLGLGNCSPQTQPTLYVGKFKLNLTQTIEIWVKLGQVRYSLFLQL